MFNRYTREGDTHVHIKQQPHDAADAARLYGQIRDKAEAEAARAVIDHFGANNEFRVVKMCREYAVERDEELTMALFSINGVSYELNVAVGRSLGERIEEAIANAVTCEILRQLRRK